ASSTLAAQSNSCPSDITMSPTDSWIVSSSSTINARCFIRIPPPPVQEAVKRSRSFPLPLHCRLPVSRHVPPRSGEQLGARTRSLGSSCSTAPAQTRADRLGLDHQAHRQ